jgi:flavorubredoxin
METRIDEIGDRIYRLSTYVPDIEPPVGFTFNQFLILSDEPLLFHAGFRRMFPMVSEAVSRLMPVEALRWITFGHYEADECGAMNEWLAVAPNAQVAHGMTGCSVSLNDMADRVPRGLANGEVIDIGGKRIRYADTPHVPHGWDAGVIYEDQRRGKGALAYRRCPVGQRPRRRVRDVPVSSRQTSRCGSWRMRG